MLISFLAAEDTTAAGSPILNIVVFVAFIVATMLIVTRVGKSGNKGASDFYISGAQSSGTQNGPTITGDYFSVASLLGIAGVIVLTGHDGFLYSIGFSVAWLVALLLVTEPLRNVGKLTMADILSSRLKQRPARTAAAISTLAVTLLYLIAQTAGAGFLVAVPFNIHDSTQQSIVVAVVGIITAAYVLIGGMKDTTYVRMVKAVLLAGAVIIMTPIILVGVKGNFSQLPQDAVGVHASSDHIVEKGYEAPAVLRPGLKYDGSLVQQLDFISLGLALVLGVTGPPHVLMRLCTASTAKEARKSAVWAIILIGGFHLLTPVLSCGVAALAGPDRVNAAPGRANAAALLLAFELGGSIFMTVVPAVTFATVLAMVAGLAVTASASVGQDLYQAVVRKGQAMEAKQARASRITVIVLGVAAIILGTLAMGQNVAFLVSLAFVAAASADVPTILMSLFWKRFNTAGVVVSMYTGVIASLVLIISSPAVPSSESSMTPSVDFSWFPLTLSGLLATPLTFLVSITTTYMGKPGNFDDLTAEMGVRSPTGVGIEAAIDH